MQIRVDASFTIKQKDQLMEELGINPGGRVQKIIDNSTIHYLRLLMPRDDAQFMIKNTKSVKPGLIEVQAPYAHYQNTGILYLTKDGRSWAHKNEPKYPTGKSLNYHDSPNRGAHFVERTLTEHFDDILKEAKKGVRK